MKINTARVETFSDGVLSIVITIMVLSLHMPDIDKENSTWTIRSHMKHLLPYLSTYAFSFLMIGIFWINHHHMFHLLEKTDERLLLQNLLFLFFVSLIPISTALLGANPLLADTVSVYGLLMFLCTLSFAMMRAYTIKKGLVHKDPNKELNSKISNVSLKARAKSYIGTIAYLISVPLAFVNVYVSFVCFIITPVIFFIPDGIDDEQLAEKIEEKNSV
jgi:uncharacterized membrane protein